MNTNLKIVLADDQPIYLGGLKLLLEQEEGIEIVGQAENGIQLLYLVEECAPDVVITDIEMPEMDGVEASKKLKKKKPGAAIVALTIYDEDWRVMDMLNAGARGYLLKNSRREELVAAIKAVAAGGFYFCSSTSLRLLQRLAESGLPVCREESCVFNETEKQIVVLICKQYSSKEIAGALQLQVKTIENYRNRLIEKTGMINMAGLVVYAIKHGLYKPE